MLLQFFRAGIATRSIRGLVGSRVSSAVRVGKNCGIIRSRLMGRITLGDGTQCYHVNASGEIDIGRHTFLNGPRIDLVSSLNPISIGNFCSIARGAQVQEYNHRTSGLSSAFLTRRINPQSATSQDEIESRGPVRIGHDVWLGANSVVVSGVTIGTGAVVAAGAIVTRDVPPYAIVAGNPARVIRLRFEDEGIMRELLESEWWTWPLADIEKYAHQFGTHQRAD